MRSCECIKKTFVASQTTENLSRTFHCKLIISFAKFEDVRLFSNREIRSRVFNEYFRTELRKVCLTSFLKCYRVALRKVNVGKQGVAQSGTIMRPCTDGVVLYKTFF